MLKKGLRADAGQAMEADVVVRGNGYAVALRYDRNTSSAPVITVSGTGKDAESILHHAWCGSVPIWKDGDLAVELFWQDGECGDEIDPELYWAVADVFSELYLGRMED